MSRRRLDDTVCDKIRIAGDEATMTPNGGTGDSVSRSLEQVTEWAVDQEIFDRLSRRLETVSRRRGFGSLAAIGLALGVGLPGAVDARKKKKRKKKKKAAACPGGCRSNEVCRDGACVDPSCGACAQGQQCIYGVCQSPTCNRIEYGGDCPVNQQCCQVAGAMTNGALAQPICLRDDDVIGSPYYSCQMPVGSTFQSWPYNIIGEACTTGNVQRDPNGVYRCCSGWGDTDYGDPANCCGHRYEGEGHSVNGLCCIASGKSCSGSTLCCNGQTCPGTGICP